MECYFCNKHTVFGNAISHSNHKTNRMWKANLRPKRIEISGQRKKVHLCTRCLRTMDKKS